MSIVPTVFSFVLTKATESSRKLDNKTMSTSYNPSNSLNINHNGWKNLKNSLLSHHGDEILLKVKTLDNNYKKLAAVNNNIVFLYQCNKLGIVPKGLRLKFTHKSLEIQEFMKKVTIKFITKYWEPPSPLRFLRKNCKLELM